MDLENNPVMYVFNLLGAAINGILQVFTDFLNLVIEMVPNPDPFPEIINSLPEDVVLDSGFYLYWIDAFVGISEANLVIVNFVALWVASLVFALVFKVAGMIKP